MSPNSKETELGSGDQEVSSSAGKNTGVVLVTSLHIWKCIPTAISGGVDISEVSGCHLLGQVGSQIGSQKYFKDWYLKNSGPTFLFLAYF